jgi:hypothetical protein
MTVQSICSHISERYLYVSETTVVAAQALEGIGRGKSVP